MSTQTGASVAQHVLTDSPYRGWFDPVSLDLFTGMLNLAEDGSPTCDLLASTVERLSLAFAPEIAVGLLIDPPGASVPSGDLNEPCFQRGDRIVDLVRTAGLIVVTDGGVARVGDAREVAAWLAALPSGASWLVCHTGLGERTAVVALHYPDLPAGQSRLLQKSLGQVMAAIAAAPNAPRTRRSDAR